MQAVKDKHDFSDGQKYLKVINNGLYKNINLRDPNFKTVAIHYLREGFCEFKTLCSLYLRHIIMAIEDLQRIALLPDLPCLIRIKNVLDTSGLNFSSLRKAF